MVKINNEKINDRSFGIVLTRRTRHPRTLNTLSSSWVKQRRCLSQQWNCWEMSFRIHTRIASTQADSTESTRLSKLKKGRP